MRETSPMGSRTEGEEARPTRLLYVRSTPRCGPAPALRPTFGCVLQTKSERDLNHLSSVAPQKPTCLPQLKLQSDTLFLPPSLCAVTGPARRYVGHLCRRRSHAPYLSSDRRSPSKTSFTNGIDFQGGSGGLYPSRGT